MIKTWKERIDFNGPSKLRTGIEHMPVAVVGGHRRGWFYLDGRPNVSIGDKLYAAPVPAQPAKPLTDEQIEELWQYSSMDEFNRFRLEFARAIEAAHGIK
jgi:hypothetical protein